MEKGCENNRLRVRRGLRRRSRQKLPGINHTASGRGEICPVRTREWCIESMKVTGTNGVGSLGGAKAAGTSRSGGGFSLPATGAAGSAAGVARTGGVAGVGSLDALLAMQDVEGPLERRRRAVGRAGRILDVLDEVKLALIDGQVSSTSLDRLMRAVREERQNTDDGRLEGVLNEIETRAAVEVAKLERAKNAA